MTPREAALQVLIACRREQGWSNAVVKQQIHAARLSRRDASLAARLSYGVIQNRMLLDFYLEQLLTDKQKKLHPVLRDILHLGLYQLKCMDRIPHSAAVNESVALAKRACPKLTFAPGLVNAVLRGAARTQLDQPEDLPTLYSHPRKLVSLLTAYVGEENLEGMLRADNEIAPTVAQVNTLRTTAAELSACLQAQGVTVAPHSWMKTPWCFPAPAIWRSWKPSKRASFTFRTRHPAWRWSVPKSQQKQTGRCWTAAPPPAARALPLPWPWQAADTSPLATSTPTKSAFCAPVPSGWGWTT